MQQLKRISPREKTVLYNNDISTIEIGYRHCDIIHRFKDEISKSSYDQGFYTSKDRFVDRIEAMKIAYKCGQIPEHLSISGYTYDGEPVYNNLFSENLY